MNNEYYLNQINNKIATTNGNLDEIIENQQALINNQVTIIEYQQEIISGDQLLRQQITKNVELTFIVALICTMTIIYQFIIRCFK